MPSRIAARCFMGMLDILFPKRCVGCRSLGSYLCLACEAKLKPAIEQLCLICDRPAIGGLTHRACQDPFSIDGVSAAYVFASPMRELLHALKYRGVSDVVTTCVRLMTPIIPQHILARQPIIVPVPLHPNRKRERGFNQSELLAKRIAKDLNLVIAPNILTRVKNTQSQTTLNRLERKANMVEVFQCLGHVEGKSILLIDDTVTTGATLSSCARELKQKGANYVWAIALAQAPLKKEYV